MRVTGRTLGTYYRAQKIRKKKVVIKKIINQFKAQQQRQQINFMRAELRSIIWRDKPILFLDECVFSVRTYDQRAWSRVNEYPTVAAK